MRVRFAKVYRAFSQLDQFSDRECEGYVRLTKAQYRFESAGAVLFGMVLGAAALVLLLALTLIASRLIASSGVGWARGVSQVVGFGGVVLSFTGGPVVGMLWYKRWLRCMIVQRLKAVQCGACDYSLLGLKIMGDGVICPECGQRFDLAGRGLSAADVLSQSPAPTE